MDFWTVWHFICDEVGRFEDFTVCVFLYIDFGFFPVLKKAAPTKILGFGFELLKLAKVKIFLHSVGLVSYTGAVVLVGAGLSLVG